MASDPSAVVGLKYGRYATPPTDDELRELCPLSHSLLRSDGVDLIYDNVARMNGFNFRQAMLSEMWVHRAHGRILKYFVHAVADPEESGNVFFGVSEASLPWVDGKTEGVDCSGQVRRGPTPHPVATARTAVTTLPSRAPKTATFVVQIDFSANEAWIGAYRDYTCAKEGLDLIFHHSVDISEWNSARLWFTMGEQDTSVCLAKVERSSPAPTGEGFWSNAGWSASE